MRNWMIGSIAVMVALWIGVECGYRIGSHNPNRSQWMRRDDAIELATERQSVGYDRGFQACQEQF